MTVSLAPGTVTATSTVEHAAIGLPGIADIAVDGLIAKSTATCEGATGSTSAVLRIGGTVVPVTGEANQVIALPGGATIVANEQTPTEDGNGVTVTGLHVTAPGLADIRLATATGAAHHCAAALA